MLICEWFDPDAMPNRAYVKGRNFEYRVRDQLRKDGFVVLRQAKSSFPDLYAIRFGNDLRHDIRIVECRVDGYLSPRERYEMLHMAARIGATPMVALRKGRRLVLEVLKES